MATVRRENGDLTPQEEKEVQVVFEHACTWREKLETLSEDFDKKGYFGLMWDSKVPEKDKWFFYFFTFKASNKDDVKEKIQKYLDFYREMSEIANQMMNNSEATSQRDKDACQLVKELRENLMKLSSAAEAGGKTTDSSTVYRLHREFIDKHQKLEHLIKMVECVALKQSREMAMERSQKIEKLMNTYMKKSEKRFEALCDKFDKLMTKHEDVTEEKRDLRQANNSMELQNRQLLEKSNEQKERLEALNQERAEMAQINQRLENKHDEVCDKFKQLFETHQEVKRDNGVMRAEKNLLQERSLDQAEQIETLRRERRELEQENERLEQERRDQSQAINELQAQLVLSLLDRSAVNGPVP